MIEIKLTISVLLSDRSDTIKRCLDSLRSLREKVNSELILTVTTEDPRVLRIAEEYGDRVIPFLWCNDFSKARNVGLEAARGRWFLYLDDDEWFEDCGELIRFFTGGESEKYAYADYIQRNYQDRGLHYYADTPVSRMVNLKYGRNKAGLPGNRGTNEGTQIRFRSRIHEYFDPVNGPGKLLSRTIANHTGYIQTDEQTQQARFRRNAPLLLQMMEEEPDNPRWPIQLVQEYRQVELWAWEAELGRKCLYGTGAPAREASVPETGGQKPLPALDEDSFGAFCGAAVEGLAESERGAEALAIIGECLEDPRCVDMTRAFLYLEKALIMLREGIWSRQSAAGSSGDGARDSVTDDPLLCAEKLVEQYFQVCGELDRHPEKRAGQSAMVIVGEATERISRIKAESIRLCCRLLMGDHAYFERALPALEWDQPAVYLLDELVTVWVGDMAQSPETEGARHHSDSRQSAFDDPWAKPLALAWKNDRVRERLLKEAQKRETLTLLRQIAELKEEHWYISYARACVRQEIGDKAKIKALLVDYFNKCENIFRIPERIREVMKDREFSWEELTGGVDFVKLSRDMAEYYESRADQGAVDLAEEQLPDTEEILELWVKKGTAYVHRRYHPAIIQEDPGCLPRECRAVLCLEQASSHVQGLKAAIQQWPGLVTFAKAYAFELQSAEADRPDRDAGTAKPDRQAAGVWSEMDLLAAQILAQVRQLMAQGERAQAAAILAQLKTMAPENEELLRLEEELAKG